MQGFVFFSLIVWLFSVTGADGKLTRRPSNNILVRGLEAPFYCTSDSKAPVWNAHLLTDPRTDSSVMMIDESCTWTRDGSVITKKSESASPPHSCDVFQKFLSSEHTMKVSCTDGTDTASAILIFFDSLSCGILVNQYECTLEGSTYKNTTGPVNPYISTIITWKDDDGNVVAQKYADTQDKQTVLTTEIPISPSKDSPYVCSVEYKMEGDITPEYSSSILGPSEGIRCAYPTSPAAELAAREASKAAAAAALSAAKTNATSRAKLERDGVDAIAMLMSLMTAFLVL